MVKRIFILLSFAVLPLFAAESGTLAYHGDKAFRAGKFAIAEDFYTRALLQSRKEADIHSEGRILIAMAELRTQSLDTETAEVLLHKVRKTDLDSNALAAYYLAWMHLFLERKNYGKVVDIKYSLTNAFLKQMPSGIRGDILCASGIAFAGMEDRTQAEKYLEDAEDAFDGDSPGKLLFAKARAAAFFNARSTDSLYARALEFSIQAKRPFFSATILFYRGMASSNFEQANDFLKRSANAFELLGLPKNRERAFKAIQE